MFQEWQPRSVQWIFLLYLSALQTKSHPAHTHTRVRCSEKLFRGLNHLTKSWICEKNLLPWKFRAMRFTHLLKRPSLEGRAHPESCWATRNTAAVVGVLKFSCISHTTATSTSCPESKQNDKHRLLLLCTIFHLVGFHNENSFHPLWHFWTKKLQLEATTTKAGWLFLLDTSYVWCTRRKLALLFKAWHI